MRLVSLNVIFMALMLLPLMQAFDFFQLFEEAEHAAHQAQTRQQRARPASDRGRAGAGAGAGESDKSSKGGHPLSTVQFCAGYACPGGSACVAKPYDCPCPFGHVKFPLQDWYACIRKDQIGHDFLLASA